MNVYPDATQAWDRTIGMARSLGADLPRAVFEGWLTLRDLDGLVRRCKDCAQDGCKPAGMVRKGAETGVAAVCANRSDLEALRL